MACAMPDEVSHSGFKDLITKACASNSRAMLSRDEFFPLAFGSASAWTTRAVLSLAAGGFGFSSLPAGFAGFVAGFFLPPPDPESEDELDPSEESSESSSGDSSFSPQWLSCLEAGRSWTSFSCQTASSQPPSPWTRKPFRP
jgi:hypothetical protein